MDNIKEVSEPSKYKVWTGRVLSILSVLFFLFDSIAKIMRVPAVVKATVELGYPAHLVVVIGILLLVSTILYCIPRTSVLGAILLTGYLGGAVATNLRVDAPLFSNVLFPVYTGIVVWAGLWIRSSLLRSLIPIKK